MSTFHFKKFDIDQSDVAMKVGTDGVLLGAWVALGCDTKRILDIGTGTGVIALMAAQRSNADYIAGIDSDENAVRCATKNFDSSIWSNRLCAICSSVQEFNPVEKFNVIVSNPPYFVNSLPSPDKRRTMARHTTSLTFEELSVSICRLLARNGQAALILPPEQMDDFVKQTALVMTRMCEVRSVPNGAVKRVLAEFAHTGKMNAIVERLVIETNERGVFSDEYRRLTKDFYLKF